MQLRKTCTVLALLLAAWGGLSQAAKAAVIGMSAEIGDGPAAIGFQEFIPRTNPRAKHNLDTLRFFEQVFAPGGPSGPVTNQGVAWWDVDIEITRDAAQNGDEMVALDKFVFNNTGIDWDDFHITLGMRDDLGNFMESDELDDLYFKTDPAPLNERAIFTSSPVFDNPPMLDEPVNPDNLWWNGGTLPSGLDTSFWLGLNIPDAKFIVDPNNTGIETALITIRQHATVAGVPEPATTLALLGIGGALAVKTLSRRKKSS